MTRLVSKAQKKIMTGNMAGRKLFPSPGQKGDNRWLLWLVVLIIVAGSPIRKSFGGRRAVFGGIGGEESGEVQVPTRPKQPLIPGAAKGAGWCREERGLDFQDRNGDGFLFR